MRKLALSVLGAALATALCSTTASAQGFYASCMCEHFGSQYDGFCEAWPQTGDERYYWSTWGAAYLPYPLDPTSGFGYYDVWRRGYAGGLDVTVLKLSTGQTSSLRCGGWTGGE